MFGGALMTKTFLCANIILILFSLHGCTTTPGINSGSIEVINEDINLRVAFNENDREKINRYYGHNKKEKKSKKMPPGLAKKDSLPPGLQKHIEKNGVLPPGLEGRNLPVGLEQALSTLPQGYVRVKIGGDVILMNEISRVVFDVIFGVDS